MLPYETYKTVHFIGLAMVLLSLGALIVHQQTILSKRTLAVTHGIGLLLLLVTGFGMLAKAGIHSVPGWVGGKLAIWLILGAYMALIPRLRNRQAGLLWWSIVVLVGTAGYLATTKPF
jgi:hypothetical protein